MFAITIISPYMYRLSTNQSAINSFLKTRGIFKRQQAVQPKIRIGKSRTTTSQEQAQMVLKFGPEVMVYNKTDISAVY